MREIGGLCAILLISSVSFDSFSTIHAQAGAILRGMVTLESHNTPVHGASVLIVQLGRSTLSDNEDVFVFSNLPPGTYTVVVHLHGLTDERQSVQVKAGETATLDFQLGLSAIKDEITVTASGREETSFNSFQSVATLESIELASKAQTALGEVQSRRSLVSKSLVLH
ncbi:MAG: carboxypeptidase-like regulatory domain-containing protein [Acidobacteria bacterium]|nr:carboxypeptidase-like regulatory domain-containing protein [Acidobacteriota bacterium]